MGRARRGMRAFACTCACARDGGKQPRACSGGGGVSVSKRVGEASVGGGGRAGACELRGAMGP